MTKTLDEQSAPRSPRKNRLVGAVVVVLVLAVGFHVARSLLPDNSPRIKFSKRSVTMLEKNDPIKFNGVKIGKIESVDGSVVGVEITGRLEKEIPIPRGANIYEMSMGFLGGNMIQIASNTEGGDSYGPGEVIPLFESRSNLASSISDAFSSPEKLDTIIAILRRLERKRAEEQ